MHSSGVMESSLVVLAVAFISCLFLNGATALAFSKNPSSLRPFYSDSAIQRDCSHVLPNVTLNLYLNTTRFVVLTNNGVLFQSTLQERVKPLYLTATDVERIMLTAAQNTTSLQELVETNAILAWVGKHKDSDYWVLYISNMDELDMEQIGGTTCHVQPLREFGDELQSTVDAGILATANGLVEFHKSHSFCSNCGSPTVIAKAGACRTCFTGSCQRRIYPRMDLASIMLITSSCGKYALLGRKKSWPKGRYSTLAGFAEVGETIEDCCIRETLEESGVVVDPASVTFIASQPWPFPQSLMVGFRGRAYPQEQGTLPRIEVNVDEMENVQWFSRNICAREIRGRIICAGLRPNNARTRVSHSWAIQSGSTFDYSMGK